MFFLSTGLPTLAGCPLSDGTLSTSSLPSIPGLFLCGRQHPASGCLTAPEHPSAPPPPEQNAIKFHRSKTARRQKETVHILEPNGLISSQLSAALTRVILSGRPLCHDLSCHFNQVAPNYYVATSCVVTGETVRTPSGLTPRSVRRW